MFANVDESFDCVKKFLQDLASGRTTKARAKEIRREIYEVTARLEKVRRLMPEVAAECDLSEEVYDLLKIVDRDRGWSGVAALL